ncbi:multisubunit potassium/proton antiporter PhaD subunit [Palleronia aestuarii]|uniref:Multisubunit potassium/proton antiporter PhaD subunit n=1 Tax=Palleronia aestuarii TaxID=568105 RepID=A0A2W7N3J8_9RHOB|nr:monovalent cation/H+ antiporter subunit D [Palleronia aestuarii]PZX12927.1 multisubunit potassium/proton antiporter PhaD subunit [Palleronia aestuarii]
MTHWTVLPVVLPAMLGAIIVLATRFHLSLARVFSMAGTLALLVLALGLFWRASDGTISLYQLGDWAAPFGIVLVADRLSTLMVLLTALLAVPVVLYAIGSGWDARGRHFHALFQFQLMGIMGAFLTGDAFNLFVFFEILLIASYGLMIHAGGSARLRAGTQYVLYNLLGSTLFLFALGTIYAETGTLNMADLAVRVAAIDPDASAGIRVASVLLLAVFAIKAAILPLHFWLPGSYAEAPAPVAALFAIMTKVGAYGIIRFYTLVFPPELSLTNGLFDTWLLPAALLTLAIGMIGVLGAREVGRLVAFSAVGSMGMMLIAVAAFTPQGIAAALYYAVHSTFAAAVLFLVVDLVRERRGEVAGRLDPTNPMQGGAMVAGAYFVGAIIMCGLPPLSGFLGKLLVMDAVRDVAWFGWAWAVILASSLVAIVGFSRGGSEIFWKSHEVAIGHPGEETEAGERNVADPAAPPAVMQMVAIGLLIAASVAATVFAGPLQRTLMATSDQLFAPEPYISTVMETPGKTITHGYESAEGDAPPTPDEEH